MHVTPLLLSMETTAGRQVLGVTEDRLGVGNFMRLASFALLGGDGGDDLLKRSISAVLLSSLAVLLTFLEELWPSEVRYEGLSSVVDLSLLKVVLMISGG